MVLVLARVPQSASVTSPTRQSSLNDSHTM